MKQSRPLFLIKKHYLEFTANLEDQKYLQEKNKFWFTQFLIW